MKRVVALALVLMGAGAAEAGAQSGLASRIASPWPGLQAANGSFPDDLHPGKRTCYGDAMLGLGLMQVGIARDADDTTRSGLRAVTAGVRHDRKICGSDRVFENWAVAAAYNLARRRLARAPSFKQRRPGWERHLKAAEARWIYERGERRSRFAGDALFARFSARWSSEQALRRRRPFTGFYNKQLVDAAAVLELLETGLSSDRDASVLGGDRPRARRAALRLIRRTIPRRVKSTRTLLSDEPVSPPAYNALDLAFYLRASRLAGRRAPARRTIVRLTKASWKLSAPDGDVSYWGRSQEQSWTLSATAYAALAAARWVGPLWEARLRSLAGRTLARLAGYGIGARGLRIAPVLGLGPAGAKGVDGYSGVPQYNGLTLVFLNWANRLGSSPTTDGGDTDALLGKGVGRFASIRRGATWYAVKLAPSVSGDLRFDFGLLAAQRLTGGAWRRIVPIRPYTVGGPDSAGPVLLSGGRRGLPIARRPRLGAGSLAADVSFRTLAGDFLAMDRPVTFRAAGCGVEQTMGGPAGQLYELSLFFPAAPARSGNSLTGGGVSAGFSRGFEQAGEQAGLLSGAERLTRVRVRVVSPFTVRLC